MILRLLSIICILLPFLSFGKDSCIDVSLKVDFELKRTGTLIVGREYNYVFEYDTIPIHSQSIYFKDCLGEPRQLVIDFISDKGETLSFIIFLEPKQNQALTIGSINDSLYYTMSGSKTQEEYQHFNTVENEIMKKYNKRDSLEVFQKEFVHKFPDSFISGLAIALNASTWGSDTLEHYLSKLTPRARKYKYGKFSDEILVRKKENDLGKPMQSFAALDWTGNSFASSKLSGKVELLEFWASWCEPCRKSFPELQKLIKQYQPLGLEVLGISEDMHKEAWLKAIETDSLQNWYHILSGLKEDVESKGPEKRISYRFGVTAFPTRMLVDANGTIIGRWEGESPENTESLKVLLAKEFSKE